jgi:hypothetical protein
MLLLSSKIHSSRNVRLPRLLPSHPLAPLLLIMSLARYPRFLLVAKALSNRRPQYHLQKQIDGPSYLDME